MKLITISGVDGSGKSTQLGLLEEQLRQEGFKTFYFHAVEFSLANRLSRLFSGKKAFVAGQEKASTRASRFAILLRRIFLMIDIFRFRDLTKKLKQAGFDYILSDRYFYDSVINIEYLSKRSKTLPCERFIPKPDAAFYMDITAEEILKRERVPEQGSEYLRGKIALFTKKKASWDLISLDASSARVRIFDSLWSMIHTPSG